MQYLKQVTGGFNNTSMLSDGENSSEFTGSIDTGSYVLNGAISGSLFGGVPNNKITAFAGESATGKTFFVLGIIKKFLDDNPHGGVVYFDTEAAVTKNMMEDRAIDTSRIVISEPESIEEFRTTAINMIKRYSEVADKEKEPMIMVLDSLGMLSSKKELEDVTDGKDTRDMTKAQLLRGTFRTLSLKLAKAGIPLLVTNHVWTTIGGYIPQKEMSGGLGLKYAASTIVMLTKKKDRDGTNVVGNIIKATMHKSRLSKENQFVEVKLSYDKGLDRYYGLLELGEKHGVYTREGNKYVTPEGKKVFAKAIYKEPHKHIEPFLDKLEVAAKAEFEYGREDEQDETEVSVDGNE